MIIHIATDHAGLYLKNSIKSYLINSGYEVNDHGAYEYDPLDDYPDFIFPCAKAVAKDIDSRDKMTMEESLFLNLKQKINKNKIVMMITLALAALVLLMLLYL